MTSQLSILAAPAAGGAERVDANPARNGRCAPALKWKAPEAAAVVDGPAQLAAAEAAYEQALSHATRARTVGQVRERFDLADQRMLELRLAARRRRRGGG